MSLFARKPKEPDDGLLPGDMALLTVDLERHPDYEPQPVRFSFDGYSNGRLDRDVEWTVGERGASAIGLFDESGKLLWFSRMTILPGCIVGWYSDETQEAKRIQAQRDNPDIL